MYVEVISNVLLASIRTAVFFLSDRRETCVIFWCLPPPPPSKNLDRPPAKRHVYLLSTMNGK